MRGRIGAKGLYMDHEQVNRKKKEKRKMEASSRYRYIYRASMLINYFCILVYYLMLKDSGISCQNGLIAMVRLDRERSK